MKYNDLNLELSSEDKLLLLCARTEMTDEIVKKIKSLVQKEIDWDYLLHRSFKNRLTPLLFIQLNSICHDSVPSEVMESLKITFYENAHKNLIFMRELLSVLKLFKSKGITAIPYKGPVLAIQAYGSLAYREFGDLDIYIPKENILKAKDLLISQGYTPQIQLNDVQDALQLKFQREYKLISSEGVPVEIQWKFSGICTSFSKDPYLLFDRHLKSIQLNGFSIMSFSKEDLLLILSIHCAGHLWSNLSWICDISEIIQKNRDINWGMIINNAKELGILRILFVTLLLVNDLFGIEIPKRILNEMYNHKSLNRILTQIKKFLMEPSYSPTIFDVSISSIKIRENLIHGIRDSTFFITSPTVEEWKIISLPLFLSSLYYILRPIRIIKKYGYKLIKFKTKFNLFNYNK